MNFLNDGARDAPRNTDRTNEEFRGQGGNHLHRHPRNYGGGDQVDLRDKIRRDRQKGVSRRSITGPALYYRHCVFIANRSRLSFCQVLQDTLN